MSLVGSAALGFLVLAVFTPTFHGYQLPGQCLACLTIGIYPFIGAAYAYLQRDSGDRPQTSLLGGGVASAIVFLLYVTTSMASSPAGLSGALGEALQGLANYYPDAMPLALVAALTGLGIAFTAIASLGGLAGMTVSMVMQRGRV